jgi:hypothetical protein
LSLDNAHFLEQITTIREDILDKDRMDKEDGFSHPAESAIYGILGKQVELKEIAIELYADLSELKVVDWQFKDDVLKDMRKTIKRKIRTCFSAEELEGMVSAMVNLMKVHL